MNSKRMTRMALAACALVPGTALAADLGPYRPAPPPPARYDSVPPVWQGLYVGLNTGYGWGEADGRYSGPGLGDSLIVEPEGAFGGAQAGYNAQFGAFVLGVEGDIQLSDLSETAAATTGAGFAARATTDVEWFSTLRGRAGLAMGRTLLYATGGVAFADIDHRFVASNGVSAVAASSSDTETGYVLGGGIEYMLTQNLTTKFEYQYLDFGEQTLTGIGSDGNSNGSKVDTDFHTLRLGLNYKF